MSSLYIIGTPIGNLEDITLRAIAVLSSVDLIVCEDTRVTQGLLHKYSIEKPLLSFHAKSGQSKIDAICKLIESGKNVALVTDAGTPGISDPGSKLVSAVREKVPETSIVSIPGPSALTAALSVAGVGASEFLFLGFLPHKKGRETLLKEITQSDRTVVFYESPHRIVRTLTRLAELAPEHAIVLCRELTKMFEETLTGTAAELLDNLQEKPERLRGEFVVIVEVGKKKKVAAH